MSQRWVSPCVKRKIVRELMETSGVMHTVPAAFERNRMMLGSSVNFHCSQHMYVLYLPSDNGCRTMLTALAIGTIVFGLCSHVDFTRPCAWSQDM